MRRRLIAVIAALSLAVAVLPYAFAAQAESVVMTDRQIASALGKLGDDGILWMMPALAQDCSSATVTLPVAALAPDAICGAGVGIVTPHVTVVFPAGTWENIHAQAGGTLVLTVAPVPLSDGLPYETQVLLNGRPAYDIMLTTDGKRPLTRELGEFRLIFPYTLRAGESAESVFVGLISSVGALTTVERSLWKDGAVTAVVRYQGAYGILSRIVWFSDTAGHWGIQDIGFAAARGVMIGMTATEFEPNRSVSWAMACTVFARLGSAEIGAGGANWYTTYVNWAISNGLMSGGQDPAQDISREDFASLLTGFLRLTGRVDPALLALNYPDRESIAPRNWNGVAVTTAAGLMQGREDGRFDPKSPLTRAELAATLHRLIVLTLA